MKADQEDFIINDKRDLLEFFKRAEDRFDENGKQYALIKNDNTYLIGRLQRLYWVFNGQISDHTGGHKDDLHYDFKYRFLIRIFSRNPDEHPGHENIIENMIIIKNEKPEMFEQMKKTVVHGTHHKEASEDEIREFIRYVEEEGIRLGVRFKISKKQEDELRFSQPSDNG